MGFFSDIGHNLFGGSNADNPGWMTDEGKGIFDQFGQMANAFDPRMSVANSMENFDRMGRNAGNALGARGFGGAGNPGIAATRARFGAQAWTDANKQNMDWKRGILGQQFGMLPGLEGLFHKTYQPGLGQQIGGAVAGKWAEKQLGLGGNNNSNNSNGNTSGSSNGDNNNFIGQAVPLSPGGGFSTMPGLGYQGPGMNGLNDPNAQMAQSNPWKINFGGAQRQQSRRSGLNW